MRRGALWPLAAAACAALMLAGCASVGPAPKNDTVKVSISADDDVNPTADGRPSSLVLRVYQLKADTRFLAADFFDLIGKEEEVLAGDVLLSQEFNLAPGESQELEMEISAEATLLGVVAAYRDIRNAQWRVVQGAPKKGLKNLIRKDAVTIHAERAAVTLTIRE